MNTKTQIIQFSSLFLLLLVTGTFWGTWFTLTRSLEDFQIEEFIHIGKVIISNVAMPMRIMMPGCIVCMIALCWIYPEKKSMGFYSSVTALVLIIITLAITLIVLVPMDNEIKEWTVSTAPSDWREFQMRWKSFHAIRTFTSLASFACMVVSVIVSGKR